MKMVKEREREREREREKEEASKKLKPGVVVLPIRKMLPAKRSNPTLAR